MVVSRARGTHLLKTRKSQGVLVLLRADDVCAVVHRLRNDLVGQNVCLIMPPAGIGAIVLVPVIVLQVDGENGQLSHLTSVQDSIAPLLPALSFLTMLFASIMHGCASNSI